MSKPPKGARLGERIRVHIASALQSIKDPRIGLVTVTEVRMTADNERATVYWTVFPDDDHTKERTTQGLQSATGFLRRDLGKVLHIKKVPELIFEHDEVAKEGRSIEELLAQVQHEEHVAKKGIPVNPDEDYGQSEQSDDR